MGRPQSGKHHKRGKSWHRRDADRRLQKALQLLPDVQSGADPTAGEPQPIHYYGKRRMRGDALK